MAVCYKCNCSLDDTNWMSSFKKRNQRICKSCYRSNFNSKNGPQRLYINGVYIPKGDPRHKVFKPGNYKNINDAVFSQSSINQIQEGYVYVITNKAWPDWVKIGMAIDAEDRLSGYQTSSPHRDYVLEHSVYCNDRRKSEQQAHTRATKIALETNGEWFKLTVEQAIEVLNNLDEHRPRAAKEANTDTPKDKLQERPIQEDLWTYTQNRKTA
jgi:hypothetical protein